MALARKTFKIETLMSSMGELPMSVGTGSLGGDVSERILRELQELKQLVRPQQEVSHAVVDDYRRQIGEALALKNELDSIYQAINETKREIASLHLSGFKGQEMTRVTDELGAIVSGTEGATEGILAAAEAIDEVANNLSSHLKGQNREMANEISEHVVQIFEACNFQDLTGQRITKVVNVLRFIEERVARMMDIWGGMEQFAHLEVDSMPAKEGDAALLNGPSLSTDADTVSQDDIDALFS